MIRRQGIYDLLVIGGGVAGLSAAAYAAQCGLHVALVEQRGIFGGLIANVGHVEGIFLPSNSSGQSIAESLVQRCTDSGVSILDSEVAGIVAGNPPKVLTADGTHHVSRAVIVASGASLRRMNVPGEAEFAGRGVSQCATCDGQFFTSKGVVVIGGGNAAMQEALVLADICRKVTIVSRSRLRAARNYVERLTSRPNVEFIWNTTVEAIQGGDRVANVRLRDQTTATVTTLDCSGVFPFVGVEPNAAFISASLKDNAGYIRTDDSLETAAKRIFAAGSVRGGYGGQLTQAVAEGIKAAQGAQSYCAA